MPKMRMERDAMTPNTQALQRLLDAVEGNAISTDLIMDAFGNGWDDVLVLAAFDGSLDAAKALHEALLPGWEFKIGLTNAVVFLRTHKDNDPQHSGMSEVSARAWLLAIIRAVMAGER